MPIQTDASTTGRPIEFETRVIKLSNPNINSATVIPYIRDSLKTVGCGSVIPAGPKAIQLTLPIGLMHNLQAEIEGYDQNGLEPFDDIVVYDKVVAVPKKAVFDVVVDCIAKLRLCPPDMQLLLLPKDSTTGRFGDLVFSGPASREPFYSNKIVDQLTRLVTKLSS